MFTNENTTNYIPSICLGSRFFVVNLTGRHGVSISPVGRDAPMTFIVTYIYNNKAYIAADMRSSLVDSDGHMLSYSDDYQKTVSSKFGKFLLASAGINRLTTDKKTMLDVAHDIDLWLEVNPDVHIREIAEYTANMFQRYLNENYDANVAAQGIENNKALQERLKQKMSVSFTIAGYDEAHQCCAYMSDIFPYNDDQVLYKRAYAVLGERHNNCYADFQLCQYVPASETDLLSKIEHLMKYASGHSQFVSPDFQIWKISENRITQMR